MFKNQSQTKQPKIKRNAEMISELKCRMKWTNDFILEIGLVNNLQL